MQTMSPQGLVGLGDGVGDVIGVETGRGVGSRPGIHWQPHFPVMGSYTACFSAMQTQPTHCDGSGLQEQVLVEGL